MAPGNQQPEPALPQFGHISRYWDQEHKTFTARLLPGEYYVTRHAEAVTTVLGSCVSACVRDVRLKPAAELDLPQGHPLPATFTLPYDAELLVTLVR